MIPPKIGRYQIKSELGRGGMATVYQAYDPRFRREVALKVLPREFLHDPTFHARFVREARTIASLEHPAIVPVYDFGEEDGQPYLVMRFLPGGALTDRLKEGALPFDEAIRLIKRLAPALDEAHARGIIHRDLKPDNILFDQRRQPFITDFGLVKLSERGEKLTTSQSIMGTPAYMSPEQAHGELELDGRSDIYALGIILFEILTGRLPFEATTPIGLIIKHLSEPPPPILTIKPELPPRCAAVIDRVLAKERDERFATATELAQALIQSVKARPAHRRPQTGSKSASATSKLQQAIPELAGLAKTDQIVCPKCGNGNSDQVRLCSKCGQRLKIECILCFTPNRIDATHCLHCGENLVRSRAMRRQVQKERQRTITDRDLAFQSKEVRQLQAKLEGLLKDLETRTKRTQAIRQLNRLDKHSVAVLTEALSKNRDGKLRAGLATTLGQVCATPRVKIAIKQQLTESLIKALGDSEPEVRRRAAGALGQIKGKAAEAVIEPLGLLLKDPDEAVRQQARRSLQQVGGKRAQELLGHSGKGLMGWIKENLQS